MSRPSRHSLTRSFVLAAGLLAGSSTLVPAEWLAAQQETSPAANQEAGNQEAGNQEAGNQEAGSDTAPEAFADVLAEWNAIDKQLSALADKFPTVPPDERETLRKQYAELVGIANKILPRLRSSGMAEYAAKPNADPQLTRTLLGLLGNDLKSDDYASAAELSRLLLEHQCPEKRLPLMAGYAAFGSNDFDNAARHFQQAAEQGQIDQEAETYLAQMPEFQAAWKNEQKVRAAEEAADDLPRVKLETNKGTIVLELFENQAPQAVGNFISLVESKYYDGLTFHRVLPGFMAQGGCPDGTGGGGPGYKIYCECDREDYRHHFAGTLSMAHAGKDTGGSQFFLTFRPTPHLDGRHTAFGRVIEGLEVLAKLQRRDPQRSRVEPDRIVRAEVLRKRDHKYEPKKVE